MFIAIIPFYLSTFSVKTFPLTLTIDCLSQTTDLRESSTSKCRNLNVEAAIVLYI